MFQRDTPIIEILRSCPQTQVIFKRHGMNCSNCMGASLEIIESGAKAHEINIDDLLKELNDCAEQQQK
jgi:hybrid cluster-associated redox disulfide protein